AVPRWIARLAERRLENSLSRPAIIAAVVVVVGLGAAGLAQLESRDDVRSLQRPPADLVAAEQKVRTLLGVGFDTRFVLVTAPSPEDVLQRLETLEPVLRGLVDTRAIKGALSISPSLVSIERQRADRALL